MTNSILIVFDETRQDENVCGCLSHNCFFFSKLVCTSLVECCPVLYLSHLHCPNQRYMIAQVQALSTGRKRRTDIWTVFNYNLTENKTQCTAITGEKPCGFKIGGKNTTRGT